jgi:hypothetical protein
MKARKIKQVFSERGRLQCKVGEHKERVSECEYGAYILYSYMNKIC